MTKKVLQFNNQKGYIVDVFKEVRYEFATIYRIIKL